MSQTIARSTVFLDEMGVGVQWKLRNPPAGQEAAVEDELALEPVAVAAEMPPAQPPSPEPVVMPTPAPMPIPVPMPVVAAAPTPAPSFAPEPPTAEEPLAMADEDSNAWFDEAPVPARAEPVSDAAIAAMDWAALKTAVSTCTRCTLCDTRRNAVNGRGAADASWIAIAAAPSRLDEKENQAIAGEAGQLLDNMLKAISLKPEADVYVTNLVKCRPSGPDGADRAPSGEELLACRPFLERELALTGATMAMTFGQYAAKGLMMGPAARGQVMRYGAAQLPVVATYHPDDLLRKPEDKAKAWGDLCLAKAARD
ncbi:uracil-DNA glycosylase [Duganella sp. S19_KUP01_CR8]|uniref:uracil-DNA glycosylase n=1 Tax=Duganella sp. S19_KUP01_CR8 TaxID=3025502 RepID=UPI002FCDDE86